MSGRVQVQVICPACRQQVEAVARDGRVKGYCAVAKQDVDFLIETQLIMGSEYRDKLSAAMKKRWQDPEYRTRLSAMAKIEDRDSSGRFISRKD